MRTAGITVLQVLSSSGVELGNTTVSHYKTKAPLSIKNSKQHRLKRAASGSDLHVTELGVSQVSEQFSSRFPYTFAPVQSCSFQ